MKVMVTGGSGLIGRFLLPRLEQRGYEVLNFDISNSLDIMGRAVVASAFREWQPETVIHLAAMSIVETAESNLSACMDLNVTGTINVLRACEVNRVKTVLVATSNHVYGEAVAATEETPLNGKDPYSVSKIAADYIARCYGAIAVRNTNVFGPDDPHDSHIIPGTIQAVLRGETPVIRSDGQPKKSYIYGEDVADAYITILENAEALAGQAINVVGCAPVSVYDLVNSISILMGEPTSPTIEHGPSLPSEFLDDSKLRKLGWHPKYTLRQGLLKTIKAFREQTYATTTAHS